MPTVRYEHVQNFKFDAGHARSIEDFIRMFEENLAVLKRWQEKGIRLDPRGVGSGYAIFYTNDEKVAREERFERFRTEAGNPLPRR